MDQSVDSIGSCSLDVDADSLEMSDTSSSLNFLTPLSTKDITREFTSNLRERCPVKLKTTHNMIAVCDSGAEICEGNTNNLQPVCVVSELTGANSDSSSSKKPSYLNLACCVNGYSSITTYDSKIRKDINKSREVSPIRPSSTSIQYCKKANTLAAPMQIVMSNLNNTTSLLSITPTKKLSPGVKSFEANSNYSLNDRGDLLEKPIIHSIRTLDGGNDGKTSTSFIQQRVERLYGPGALAQGFYSPKKVRDKHGDHSKSAEPTEFCRKFQQLSPSKDNCKFNNKFCTITSVTNKSKTLTAIANDNAKYNKVDLPVLRHLSQEFRDQLPAISPKRSYLTNLPNRHNEQSSDQILNKKLQNECTTSLSLTQSHLIQPAVNDEVDHKALENIKSHILPDERNPEINTFEKTELSEVTGELTEGSTCNNELGRDGNYFLVLLKNEQIRLLELANLAEKYNDMLSNNPEVSEDILGILRSASGKARLFVSQKMKQFEGLCHNNLNRSPEDKFPTTVEDLQGFWDMVNLQVEHINSIFDEIELLRKNEWKKPIEEVQHVNVKPFKQQQFMKHSCSKIKTITAVGSNNSKIASAISAAALRRETQRKQLMELKQKYKKAVAASTTSNLADESKSKNYNNVEVFVNENYS